MIARQRIAVGLGWTARVIGFSAVTLLFLEWFVIQVVGAFRRAGPFPELIAVAAVIALAGCIVSWRRTWLAGVLLIVSWLTYSRWFLSATGYLVAGSNYEYLISGLPTLLAGVLLLLSWWFSRKPIPTTPSAMADVSRKRGEGGIKSWQLFLIGFGCMLVGCFGILFGLNWWNLGYGKYTDLGGLVMFLSLIVAAFGPLVFWVIWPLVRWAHRRSKKE